MRHIPTYFIFISVHKNLCLVSFIYLLFGVAVLYASTAAVDRACDIHFKMLIKLNLIIVENLYYPRYGIHSNATFHSVWLPCTGWLAGWLGFWQFIWESNFISKMKLHMSMSLLSIHWPVYHNHYLQLGHIILPSSLALHSITSNNLTIKLKHNVDRSS